MHTMMNTLKQKRNRANGMLAKLRYYLSADILKTIYDVHFDSHMRYACHIWDQSHNKTSDMIHSAQSKALRFISFKQSMEPSESLYQNSKSISLKNIILNNFLSVFDKLNSNLPDIFDQFFSPLKNSNIYLIFQKQVHKCLIPIQ